MKLKYPLALSSKHPIPLLGRKYYCQPPPCTNYVYVGLGFLFSEKKIVCHRFGRLAVALKLTTSIPYDQAMPFLGFSPKKHTCLHTMRLQNAHNSLMYKNQMVETPKISIKGRMDK